VLQGVGLHLEVIGFQAPIALRQVAVDAGVLHHGEDVGGERPEGEQVEERAHIRGARRRAQALGYFLAEVVETGGLGREVEVEAAEL